MESAPIETALDRAKRLAGGASGLSDKLGDVTPQAISQWRRVPAERVRDVERLTGVSRYDLRPDVFGEAPKSVGAQP